MSGPYYLPPITRQALSRKQKRLNDWRALLEQEEAGSTIRQSFAITLEKYQAMIWKTWQGGSCSPEDRLTLASLERELDKVGELVRLSAAPR
jgi:hypothetical protein